MNGPKGTKYNCTKSGWFEFSIFHSWFENTLINAVRHKPGEKVLIGDNYSSYFNEDVLALCRQNDIVIVCLPPNSTHIT